MSGAAVAQKKSQNQKSKKKSKNEKTMAQKSLKIWNL